MCCLQKALHSNLRMPCTATSGVVFLGGYCFYILFIIGLLVLATLITAKTMCWVGATEFRKLWKSMTGGGAAAAAAAGGAAAAAAGSPKPGAPLLFTAWY
jgi:hypothetical protein